MSRPANPTPATPAKTTSPRRGTLTFNSGDTSKTVTVSLCPDDQDEGDETINVTLSSHSNATISATAGSAVGTITGNDSSLPEFLS